MDNKYTLDDRISDLCELENYITIQEGVEVLVSTIELIQTIQEIKQEMYRCIGCSGEFIDGKLQEWIDRLDNQTEFLRGNK